eukprot:15343659-Ditylum_brightwellii.AAC.1
MCDTGGSTSKSRCGNKAARACGRQEVCQICAEHDAKVEGVKDMERNDKAAIDNWLKHGEHAPARVEDHK